MAEQWLAKSCVKAKWEAVASTMTEEGEVDGATFVDAAKTIITIFDLITGMSIPKGDMDGNATTLGKNLGAGQSVQACILTELKTGDLKKLIADGTKSTCAALWLVRALFFIKGMIQALLNDKDVPEAKKKSLKDCVLEGYKDSLAPHHGFMTKGVFQVAVKAAPYRKDFIAKLGPDYDSVMAEFVAIKPSFEKALDAVLKCLKDNKIEA